MERMYYMHTEFLKKKSAKVFLSVNFGQFLIVILWAFIWGINHLWKLSVTFHVVKVTHLLHQTCKYRTEVVDGSNERLYYPDEEFDPNLWKGTSLQKSFETVDVYGTSFHHTCPMLPLGWNETITRLHIKVSSLHWKNNLGKAWQKISGLSKVG